jgi:hypothetical protein
MRFLLPGSLGLAACFFIATMTLGQGAPVEARKPLPHQQQPAVPLTNAGFRCSVR